MSKHFLLSTFALLVFASTAFAQPSGEKPIREIFVPFEDLPVILENDKERVFLTRQEYEDLLAVVQAKAVKQGPVNIVQLQAAYSAKIDDGRAQITGKLQFEVLHEGWQIVPLQLGGVGVQSATLDGQPAAIARLPRGPLRLFVKGQGKHELVLQLTAAVPAAAALQTLQLTLPVSPAATLELSVAGNVEIKGGASVVSRKYDEAANRTKLDLLLNSGSLNIVMSLNNKQAREQRLVVARTIQVDEITLGYERLHVNVAHRILHDPVDRFRFVVPAGFEVTSVTSQRLSRWEVKPDDKGRQILEAILSEATTDATLIAISANRSPELGQDWLASLQKWKLPRLQPLDVAGEVAVVGLLVDNLLEPQELATKQLLPIDAAILIQAMPESIFRAEPGAPVVRHVATYYVPSYIDATQYDLSANFVRPESGLVVATSLLLSLSDQGHELRGGFVISPQAEDLFQVRLRAPLGWRVNEVLGDNNQPLSLERYELADGSTRMVVNLAQRIPAGSRGKIIVRASSNPPGWLADWKEQTTTFPELILEGATRETGAIAVQTVDDLAVQPLELTGLVPLLENEKAAQGLGGVITAAAYRFESRPFAAKFRVERKQPSVAAEAFSFLHVLPDALKAHYELIYQVREARTRQLAFSLPASTPKEITILGLDGVNVKEYRSADDGDRRRWTVQLAERQAGEIRLTIDFRLPVSENQLKAYPLPLIEAEDVEFQSAFAWLEGSPELEVQATTVNRTVDEAELYQARYLLEQSVATADRRVIGAYGYQGSDGLIKIDVVRREQHALPSAIVQLAELVTRVSANGLTQSVARYDLVTKATMLEVSLPGDAVLWTMLVDGLPTKPQKEGAALLVSLPPREDLKARRVQIVYETSGQPLQLTSTISAFAPKLLLRGTGDEAGREVPQADLKWDLILPSGYQLRSSSGTVSPDKKQRPPMAALQVAAVLYELGGGVNRRIGLERQIGSIAMMSDESRSMAKREAPAGGLVENVHDSFREDLAAPQANLERYERAEIVRGQPLPTPKPGEPVPAAEAPAPPPTAMPTESPPPATPALPAADPFSGPIAMNQAPPTDGAQQAIILDDGLGQPHQAAFAALEGVSSLPIDFAPLPGADIETFRSLGVDPKLQVTLVDSTRIKYAAAGVGLLVFLMGVALTRRPAKQQAGYVIIFLLISSIPVLLTSALDELGPVFDAAFFGAAALIPYFLLASICLSLWRAIVARLPAGCCQGETTTTNVPLNSSTGTIIAPLLLAAVLLASGNSAVAAEPKPDQVKVVDLKDLLPILDPGGPVAIPVDAVIIPYDPDSEDGLAQAKKVLIPYAKFIELWNRAHPDKPKDVKPAPVDFAVLAADYQATLGATDELLVTGKLTIDVLSDKAVVIPLPFSGGVLVKATIDGQPARLQVVQPKEAAPNPPAQMQQAAALPVPEAGAVMVLHTQGAGRKTVDVAFRLGLTRRGGWRQVAAALPLGGASQLALTVPDAATEVRIAGTADKGSFDTKEANEKIETTLLGSTSGRLDLQWRPKVAIGQIDQSLTSKGTGVLDVREDALRLTWVAELSFGRGTRDQFEFSLPLGYSIEQVLSENLRGWQVKPDAARQLVEVTLLKPATGSEKFTLVLSKRGRIGTGEFATFDAPAVFVSGAALQQGELMVRRSPRLELRTETANGLVRADSDANLARAMQAADSDDPSILNLRPYQTYRFVASGTGDKFQLRLNASETAVTTSAEVRTILQVAEREATLEASIQFRPQGQPLYQADVLLPAGFELDQLLPDNVLWSVVPDAASGRKKLSIHLLDGREGEFTLTLVGRFAARAKWDEVAAPVISVLGVERQQGEVVVLSDPDTDVQATNLKNCEAGLLQQTQRWLKADQQKLARVVLNYRVPDYSATFKLTRKTPRVSVRTVSNVKVTRRAIEETVLLDYQIADAGIHELQFLLPESFKTARIRIPQEESLLQRKKIEDNKADKQIPAGWIKVTLSLQDDVTYRLGVIIEHDRLLTDKPQDVAIPQSLTGATSQRLIVIENAGRDEVVEVKRTGLEPISRQQQAWQDMIRLLGEGWSSGQHVTQAYLGVGDAQPQLTFKTQQNQQLETAKARIEFARTLLVVDEEGGYRARVTFHVSNSTEQYLDIILPPNARLWTAVVKGQPVKPVEHAPPVAGEMRIPLIKTPTGSGDYLVEIKYGGSVGKLSTLRPIKFPLISTRGINIEQSQVQLLLPESFNWPYFGGTMKQVASENELEEGFQSYFQRKVNEAKQALQSDDLNVQIRAQANLTGLMQTWQYNTYSRSANNLGQTKLAIDNYQELQSAQEEAQVQVQEQLEGLDIADNRGRLNDAWMDKKVARSKNVVTQLGRNFDQSLRPQTESSGPADSKKQSELAYNPQFLKGNMLDTEESNEKALEEEAKKFAAALPKIQNGKETDPATKAPGKPSNAPGQQQQGRVVRGGKGVPAPTEAAPAPVVVELKDLDANKALKNDADQNFSYRFGNTRELGRQSGVQPGDQSGGGRQGQGQSGSFNNNDQMRQRDNANRYQQKLQQDVQEQAAQQLQLPNQSGAGQTYNGQPSQLGSVLNPEADRRNQPGFGGAMPGGGGMGGGGVIGNAMAGERGTINLPVVDAFGASAVSGLASLEIKLPERGQVFLFTTPRGAIEITAQPVSWDLIRRWSSLAILAAVIAVGLIVYRICRQLPVRRATGTMAFAILLILGGLLSIILQVLPVVGLLLLIAGIVLVVRRALDRRAAVAAQ
ncbi:hypothetical protein ETAA8_67290 [Anatilimnocola aggregata]|uniref:Uncharacterized protein n=1 Tax=Anatilimnocola aggregata TaxID=2528021 RepID=A0A517YMW8_9BACT|nr:hypothetical protein [Anatilimnocola aggregata]QDU31570.1 hypothetical protein ETAA8_67290 [Anatilimnocola aggregata]